MTVFQRKAWSIEAEHGLQATTLSLARLRRRVESGDAELWRIQAVECEGWLVTQMQADELFVWTYQGRGFVPLARALARLARDNGLRRLGWFTRHIAARRLFRHARPVVIETREPGEFRFTLNCEDVWQLPKTLVERSPSAQSVDTISTSDSSTAKAHARLIRQRQRACGLQVRSRIRIAAGIS